MLLLNPGMLLQSIMTMMIRYSRNSWQKSAKTWHTLKKVTKILAKHGIRKNTMYF